MKNDSKETQTQHTLSVYFCGQEDCGPNHSFGPAMRPHLSSENRRRLSHPPHGLHLLPRRHLRPLELCLGRL